MKLIRKYSIRIGLYNNYVSQRWFDRKYFCFASQNLLSLSSRVTRSSSTSFTVYKIVFVNTKNGTIPQAIVSIRTLWRSKIKLMASINKFYVQKHFLVLNYNVSFET